MLYVVFTSSVPFLSYLLRTFMYLTRTQHSPFYPPTVFPLNSNALSPPFSHPLSLSPSLPLTLSLCQHRRRVSAISSVRIFSFRTLIHSTLLYLEQKTFKIILIPSKYILIPQGNKIRSIFRGRIFL